MLFIAFALTFLSAPLASQLQNQVAEFPPGIPHPTLAIAPRKLNELAEGFDVAEMDRPIWHRLDPGPLLSGNLGYSFRTARLERAEAFAVRNDWSHFELQEWLSLTAPKPVQLSFSVHRHSSQGGVQAKPVVLAAGSQPVLPGLPITLGSQIARSSLSGIDVEIASHSSIADPNVEFMFEGVSLGIAILPVSNKGWWAEAAFVISFPKASEIIPTRSADIAGKNRESMEILEFSGPLMLSADAPCVLRLPGFTAEESITLTLNVAAPAPIVIHKAGRFLALDLPTLVVDPGLRTLLDSVQDDLAWASPAGMLAVDAESGAMIAEELLKAAAEATPVALRVGIQSPGQKMEHELLNIPGVAGREYSFAVGEAFDCLVDWDAEVAQESRISAPVYSRQFSGVQGSMSASVLGGELEETFLDLRFTAVELREPATLRLGGEISFGGDSPQDMDAIQVQCERPAISIASFLWQGPLGKVLIRQTTPQELGLGPEVSLRYDASLLAKR